MNYGNLGRSFVAGFFTGTLLGAVGALLLAPASGKRLRRDLAREGKRLGHRVSEAADEVRDRSASAYESASHVFSDAKRALSR
ncbi:MAG TPA: YtxH domain-containing protein [Vicinamibacteria bacterium]|nr:YtxH domain-containing protein [Vicinamibacteria bacterium]